MVFFWYKLRSKFNSFCICFQFLNNQILRLIFVRLTVSFFFLFVISIYHFIETERRVEGGWDSTCSYLRAITVLIISV
ncbi:unnamed protein product [Acanthoscelides obtectus]|uniref:Uncharacterized protein n=1 Tax=Acanthoscelides obtectus TaxID=200917 RepID=A0A9P0QC48_ACAOB|nr:unnamed protein product [Acanthoscelides obtectus]CAH2016978.1 unnamed protein product [Acanthoscelides obtectus]CAH2018958.1 unnamed protein product [Acanthoscelides obtectus]CAH2019958.1 unnamed protein product [Acanthoscelides obtectus]CAH2020572.1 unnamed protein product [Acanthoscelides obtectus]